MKKNLYEAAKEVCIKLNNAEYVKAAGVPSAVTHTQSSIFINSCTDSDVVDGFTALMIYDKRVIRQDIDILKIFSRSLAKGYVSPDEMIEVEDK